MGTEFILTLFLMLLLGVLAYHVSQSLPKILPYSVMLIILGFAIGGINEAIKDQFDLIADISNLDPHIFMQIFLPSLIFFSVFSTNYHTIIRVFWQAFLLAVPSVVVNSLLSSLPLIYILPYKWNFKIAMIFGSVVSATDPVAVVTLLREIKASQNLATLIEAESLLNDASAIILFNILMYIVKDTAGANSTLFYLEKIFVIMTAPLLGIAMGFVAGIWVYFIRENEILETAIIFIAVNLVFLFAEYVKSSGVLALVTMGLYISRNKADITAKGLVNLEHFWELLEFFAKTLIFIISGVLVATKIIDNDYIKLIDYAYSIFIYAWINMTRAVTLTILHPALTALGNDYNWKTGIVLWYGALRGAIGLSLALIVENSNSIGIETRQKMTFHICAIVILSLVINGTTIRYILKWLKIKGSLYQSDFLIRTALDDLETKSNRLTQILAQNNHFTGANWEEVKNNMPSYSNLLKTKDYIVTSIDPYREELNIRYRIICSMKSFYWKQHHDGLITAKTYNILYDAAEFAMDYNDLSTMWKGITKHFQIPIIIIYINNFKWFKFLTRKTINNNIFQTAQLLTAFIFSADRTGIIINKFPQWKTEIMHKVELELQSIVKLAHLELHKIQETYPELYSAIQTRNAKVFLLNKDIRNIHRLKKDGIIQDEECEQMITKIEKILHKLHHINPPADKDGALAYFRSLPFVSVLEAAKIYQLYSHARHKVYGEDSFIYKKNSRKNSFFIIIKGLVEITIGEDYTRVYGPGSTINLWAAVSHNPTISSSKCLTTVNALKVTKPMISVLLKNKKSEEILWKSTGFVLMRLLFQQDLMNEEIDFRLGEICHTATLRRINGELDIMTKVLLLKGKAEDCNGKMYEAPSIIEALDSQPLSKVESVTINAMRVAFADALVLILDGRGSNVGPRLEEIEHLYSSKPDLNRQESLGLIYVKGSAESNRIQLQATPMALGGKSRTILRSATSLV